MINKLKFARLAYTNSWNLGDHIQTLATEQFLPADAISIERDQLNSYNGDDAILIMQGYFFVDEYQCSFPPSDKIKPLFAGFHIEDTWQSRSYFASETMVDFFKKNEPIGCRDESTTNFLKSIGVDAYFSRCLTLTFSRRDDSIKGTKIFFIDEPDWLKDDPAFGKKFREIYKNAEFLTQVVDSVETKLSDAEKSQMAKDRLELLKNEAKLVVTSRLHVAAPCLAMGVPVVLIPREATPVRYEAVKGLMPIYKLPTKTFSRFFGVKLGRKVRRLVQILSVRYFINWNPTALNIEKAKSNIIDDVKHRIDFIVNEYNKG